MENIKAFIPVRTKKAVKQYMYRLAGFFVRILEKITGRYITFHMRPRFASAVASPPARVSYKDYAIVMQGPLAKEDYFTLETLKLYRKFFPDALIILSTWEGEDQHSIGETKNIGVEVIQNSKPAVAGPSNVNMQLTSSKAGVKFAAERGKEYLLKTRTDQRIYHPESLLVLSNLLKSFPLRDAAGQKGRIIGIGAYNFKTKHKLFHLYDHLIFGFREDVQKYFDADLVSEKPVLEFLKKSYPDYPFTSEGYFYMEFLKKVGYEFENTEESYLRSLAERCILIDPSSLDWYWRGKHRRFLEYQILGAEYKSPRHLGFGDWLNLYQSQK